MTLLASVPATLETGRLQLRCWHPDDAVALGPLLVRSAGHLADWIPARISAPAEESVLRERLAGFATAFREDREWRYAICTRHDRTLLGEVSLFPRHARGRTALVHADRAEIGYFLDVRATGQGFAAEAAAAMLDVAAALPSLRQVEIRCDGRNRASAAIPPRLGFTLAAAAPEANPHDQCWVRTVGGGR